MFEVLGTGDTAVDLTLPVVLAEFIMSAVTTETEGGEWRAVGRLLP